MSLAHQVKPNGIAARAMAAAGTNVIPLAAIRVDGGTQSRALLHDGVIEEYAAAIADGASFPAVVIFYDGADHWLADGFHRVRAYEAAGRDMIPADIRQGTRRDAILYSVGANEAHGLRRTNEDKRRAVLTLLNDAEWSKWSDREIARRAAVSDRFVNNLRPSANGSQIARTVERNGSTYTMNTAAIGKSMPKDDDMDFAEVETESDTAPRDNRRLSLPEGAAIEEIARQGMAREADGEDPVAIAKSFGIGTHTYRMACDVVFLFDRGGYSTADAIIVEQAFRLMTELKVPEARELVNPVAVKVWGAKRDTRPRADREPARLDQFEHAFGIVMQTCATAADLDIPYLPADQIKARVREIKNARRHLLVLLTRMEEFHNG